VPCRATLHHMGHHRLATDVPLRLIFKPRGRVFSV
jgi:hypothetical protein